MADQEQPKPGQNSAAGAPSGSAGAESPTGGPPKSAAEALAAEALRAAQQAIAGISASSGGESSAGAAPSGQPQSATTAPGSPGSPGTPVNPGAVTPQPFTPPALSAAAAGEGSQGIDLLSDVDLEVKIELGRTRMFVEDVLRLREGAVVELDKLAGDPVDVYVNDRPVARGEVLILNDNFCVRINEILASVAQEA